ncbi:uncharacterized protein AB675_9012 [Cyphellophora attinorum]|uniref:F-box domain-containing protein n=1 Tax=Cyphellophora attinorum TaxID=1664694 RepID=A0A0N0NNJ5_9EURO|nr:uncharacterized protein AB675_9012 [Phialophora attinorum]KPI41449.1 hypothetical protein AB675_9012 [Phialophora attinorum]
MTRTLSAPSWDKPEPNLVSMPTEILKEIIQYTIPHVFTINATYCNNTWEQYGPFKWSPSFLPGLLLVSKRIGRVARKILFERVKFCIWVHLTWFNCLLDASHAKVPADVGIKVREHFETVFARNG